MARLLPRHLPLSPIDFFAGQPDWLLCKKPLPTSRASLPLPNAVVRPELQQVAFGDDAFQRVTIDDGDSGMACAEEGVGFLGRSVSWQGAERRSLKIAHDRMCQFFATGKVAQEQILGQT